MVEAWWVRPTLKQGSIIYYVITDAQLMAASGNVQVDKPILDVQITSLYGWN